MRIGLNLLHALPDIGGGWNYIANLVARLAQVDSQNEYVAFVTRASAELVPSARNFRSVRVAIQPKIRAARILVENSILPALVGRERLDCVHWFANGQGIINAAPAVVTIYDLQPFSVYARLSVVKRTFLRRQLRAAVYGAAVLLPMSQTTADALHEVLGADPDRMTVIPPTLEPLFAPPASAVVEAFRKRHGLPPEFWLYVAHMYPHKNHERLLLAYRAVRDAGCDTWPLVFRGESQPNGPDVAAMVGRLGLASQVIILPAVGRADVPALYGAASALVFPSLYEGAGMPVLEAQACGCPVVASSIPAVREFGGEAVSYFDPCDPEDISRAMLSLGGDATSRYELRNGGLQQAQRFRAIPLVERLLAAYIRAGRNTQRTIRRGTR